MQSLRQLRSAFYNEIMFFSMILMEKRDISQQKPISYLLWEELQLVLMRWPSATRENDRGFKQFYIKPREKNQHGPFARPNVGKTRRE
jgi:hypothetical protein